MKAAVKCGNGIPSFVKRPTPWFTYTNFNIPSQKNTPPAISLKSSVDFGPSVGRIQKPEEKLVHWLLLSPHITGATAKLFPRKDKLILDRGWPIDRVHWHC